MKTTRTLRPHQEPDEAEPRVLAPEAAFAARPWIEDEYSKARGYHLVCRRCGATTTPEDRRDDRIHFQALHSLCEEPSR